MIPLADPASYYEEDFHRHEFFVESDHICTIEFDDIEDERGGVWCEVTVYWHLDDNPEPVIAYERANLQNRTAGGIKSIKAKLEKDGYLADWEKGFDTAIFRTITEYRGASSSQGEWLEWRDSTPDDNPYLLKPFIARSGVSLVYAPMGSNKSMFVVKLGMGVATGDGVFGMEPLEKGPVLYVDFEDTPEPHRFRLTAFARSQGMEPDDLKGLIYHVRVTRSLKDARRKLRKLVRDLGIMLVIIDSIGLARASDVSGSEATIKLFKMFSALGTAVLAVDHMTKEDNKRVWKGQMDPREATPIGSQFTQSSARLGWFMNLLPDSTGQHKKFNLYNTKNNHGPTHAPIGMTLDLTSDDNDQIHLAEFKLMGMEFFVPKVGRDGSGLTKEMEMLRSHFKQGRDTNGEITALTSTAIAKLSSVNANTVRGTLRDTDLWEQVSGSKEYMLTTDGLEIAVNMWGDDV